MTLIRRLSVAACVVTSLAMLGCDWSSQGTSLNTSQGAGVTVNFSGVYNGNFGGGLAVKKTSKGNITRLVINQAGNSIEVTDNQGSHYSGSVGAPGTISSPSSDGTFPPGAEIVESQVSFSGKDGVAQKDIEFVGIFHVITVNDVKGTTDVKTDTSSGGNTSTESDNTTTTINTTITTNVVNGQTITTTETQYDLNGNIVFEAVTTTTIAPSGDKTTTTQVLTDNRTQTSSNNSTQTSTATTTYQITEANTQYRLEGTWIEKDSPIVSAVDAISRGAQGSITTTATTGTGTGTGTGG